MNFKLVVFLSLVAMAMFSSMVIAGDGCPSKDFHHKNMSADASKEFKKHHGWLYSEDKSVVEKSSEEADKVKVKDEAEPDSDVDA